MEYLKFDETQFSDLHYSLSKEYLCSNKKGAFVSSTIINCNTRKYHGLLICNLENIDTEKHLLLSAIDETILYNDKTFHLASRKYPNSIHSGYKFLENFSINPIPTFTYRVENLVLQKEILLSAEEEHVMVKYTLLEADSKTPIRLHPFIANRNVHHIQKANSCATTDIELVKNGIKTKLYEEYPWLFLQTSSKSEFQYSPDWFYNVVHEEEIYRGYESEEDLLVSGYFEFELKKGESIVFSAGLKEQSVTNLKRKFTTERNKIMTGKNMDCCLKNAANQFVVSDKKGSSILAGFPWFGVEMRDTFISLPGIFLSDMNKNNAIAVLKNASKNLQNGLFKTQRGIDNYTNNEADTPLWFIWAIQQYSNYTGDYKAVWKDFGSKIRSILDNYKKGTDYGISMHDNGLICAAQDGCALTWMNATTEFGPVTQRAGYTVEINALWYNAVSFAIELAEKSEDNKFAKKWFNFPKLIKESFVSTFWDDENKYLADFVNEEQKNMDIRPNQIIAASLQYSMLTNEQIKQVVQVVGDKLLTRRGLRSLSADNHQYIGYYDGNHYEREIAYHQGSVWPWLLAHYAEALLKTNNKTAVKEIQDLYYGFEDEMMNAGIGSISEIYDGNEPHAAKGAISQAKSVAELLRMKYIING